jgi:hypothetical protein
LKTLDARLDAKRERQNAERKSGSFLPQGSVVLVHFSLRYEHSAFRPAFFSGLLTRSVHGTGAI